MEESNNIEDQMWTDLGKGVCFLGTESQSSCSTVGLESEKKFEGEHESNHTDRRLFNEAMNEKSYVFDSKNNNFTDTLLTKQKFI